MRKEKGSHIEGAQPAPRGLRACFCGGMSVRRRLATDVGRFGGPLRFGGFLRSGGASLLLAVAVLLPCVSARGQMLFPDLVPPESFLVISVPQADGAWRAFESMRIIRSAESFLKKPVADKKGGDRTKGSAALSSRGKESAEADFPPDGATLFGGILSATELAVAPPSPSSAGPPVFLWIGRVKDPDRLRRVIAQFEEAAAKRAASPENPVTRTTEGIGDTALHFLTDRNSSVGYFLNGPSALWAFSNDPATLRATARRLANGARPGAADAEKGKSAARPTQGPMTEALRAWREMAAASPTKDPFHVRFFFPAQAGGNGAPSSDVDAASDATGFAGKQMGIGGLDPLLRKLRPEGAAAGGIRFTPLAIQVESVSLFPAGNADPAVSLYRSTPPLRGLISAPFAAPGVLIEGGNNLLNVSLMKRYLLGAVQSWQASLPSGRPSALNAASVQAQSRLSSLEEWARDPDLFTEMGPEWFFALNSFEFQGAGNLPRVDFLIGLRTRDASATRRAMLRLEEAMLRAAAAWIRNDEQGGAPPSGTPAGAAARTTPSVQPPARAGQPSAPTKDSRRDDARAAGATVTGPTTASVTIREIIEKTPRGEVVIRSFQAPRLPAYLRPAWAIWNGWVLIDLSPEMLAAAIRRAGEARASGSADDLEAARKEMGMETFHAYQVIRFRRAAKVLLAILTPIVGNIDPDAAPLVGRMGRALEPIDTMVFFRRASATGIRTVGEITMSETPPSN